MVLIDII